MREKGLDHPHVAGNSLGGAVALELGKTAPISTVTVLSPVGFSNRWEFAYGAASLRMTRAGAQVTDPVAPLLFGNRLGRTMALWHATARPWRMSGEEAVHGARAMARAPAFKDTVRAARDYRFTGPLEHLPVTIGWGTRDRVLLQRQAERARQLLPRARFVPLPGCGHVPMTDDPERVATLPLDGSAISRPAPTPS